MPNMTMRIDDKILKKVRKIAVQKNTTVTALVREHLKILASRDDMRKEILLQRLEDSFKKNTLKVGKKTWAREDLHER